MRVHLAATLLLFGVLTAAPAAAETIVNTFGPGDSFDSLGLFVGLSSFGFQQQSVAAMFTMGGETFELESIRFALSVPFPPVLGAQPGARFSVALVSSPIPSLTGIQFGTVLESFPFLFPPVFTDVDPQIFTADSTDHPLLVAGQTYFVALFPTGVGGALWHLNDQGFTGSAFRQSSATWIPCFPVNPECVTPAYEVTGSRITAVPEPASLTLLGAGLVALFAVRRKRP